MSRTQFQIHETSSIADRRKGLRDLLVTINQDGISGKRHLVSIVAMAREDISLDGDSPDFQPLPDVVLSNVEIAQALTAAAQELLNLPHLSQLGSISPRHRVSASPR